MTKWAIYDTIWAINSFSAVSSILVVAEVCIFGASASVGALLFFRRNNAKINDTHIEYSEALEDAYQCLKNKDWNNATDFCNIALKYDPENGRAYLGLLLSSMNIQNMEALKKHSKELNMNERDLLEKAIAFSDDTTQKTLIAWRDHQYQKIYKEACDLAENKEANLEKAEQLFLSIDGYRDAEQKAQMCHAFADLSGEILNSDVKQSHETKKLKKHTLIQIPFSYIGLLSLTYFAIAYICNMDANIILSFLFALFLMIDIILSFKHIWGTFGFKKITQNLFHLLIYDFAEIIVFTGPAFFIIEWIILISYLTFSLVCSPVFLIILYVKYSRKLHSLKYSVKKHRINMNDKVVEFENLTKQNRFMEKQLKHLLKLAFAE